MKGASRSSTNMTRKNFKDQFCTEKLGECISIIERVREKKSIESNYSHAESAVTTKVSSLQLAGIALTMSCMITDIIQVMIATIDPREKFSESYGEFSLLMRLTFATLNDASVTVCFIQSYLFSFPVLNQKMH